MSMSTLTQTNFSMSYVRPESHQLFFFFVGVWESMTIPALDFLRATAVGDRNVVILKDPYPGHCYQRGVSDEYDSLDGIARWQRDEIARVFPHVREIYCAGASAGGSPAIHTGCRLGARAAWSLGGRIVKPDIYDERERFSKALYTRVIGRPLLQRPSPEERARLVEALRDPEVARRRWDLSGNPDTVVPHDKERALVKLLRESRTATDYHFYYATTNVIDREFAEAFEGCPNTTFHPFTPEPRDWSQDVTFRDPDHQIVQMLNEMGELSRLFTAYL
jgi:hypothetical protein